VIELTVPASNYVVLYIKADGREIQVPGGDAGPQLHTVDLTGYNEQRVPTPAYASDPAWSPLLS
jgi:hypothetical protein